MKVFPTLSVVLIVVATTAAVPLPPSPPDRALARPASLSSIPAVRDDLIDEINSKAATWKAGRNEYFEGRTLAEVKALLGVDHDLATANTDIPVLPPPPLDDESDVPASFDSRQVWPRCIGPVLNQGSCGSCWAFGAAETASDRLCIGTNGTYVQLAPLDLVECSRGLFDHGCHGGVPPAAFHYIHSTGLTTETCFPYLQSEGGPIPTCTPSQQPCSTFVDTPSCQSSCADGSEVKRTKLSSVYSILGVKHMKKEIASNGPIEGAFLVFEDFVNYKSGVYKYTSGSLLGGHAVKIIGYGSESGEEYFLVQNSWTTAWGEGGYFKIGVNQCGIGILASTGKA
uniref:Peptidase C1A papain C-terminal domain-containing protein n=1 Tax=Palpitomonas bilix TaxID=652834 RepID=A0A7S3D4W0_9EUKA|eukprot:CAMPEP_0113889760 /NCGR_PEP_ID=MMETSP0780_2-20120614/13715_1 /TAXON_ID=652834 /ORGANISM="Palpitomonas bilix" /LENGTH=340 /DNA_ID=CAMNT_0000878973 /DNA_START=42 /DNA_END=1064 /DNA_ORIENTATION=- /assembly_acc=CAM_ASM_000599